MIASQFNLEHRIAELRQAGGQFRTDRTISAFASPLAAFAGAIRSLLGGTHVAARSSGLAAH